MSRTSRQPARKRLLASQHKGRTLDMRLAIHSPRLSAVSARLVAGLPPTSTLRQALLARAVQLSLEAYNRRDLDAVVSTWDPEFEYNPGRKWVEAGLVEASYRGLDGYRRYVAATEEVWGRENRLEPVELIDGGELVVILAQGHMRAQASGVPLTESFALVSTLKNGRPIRHQEYYTHAEALMAVGLEE